MKVKIELPKEIVEHLNTYPGGVEEMAAFIVKRDYKMKHHAKPKSSQFDNTTKLGVLKRVYYYQKKHYDPDLDRIKFINEWMNDKRFKYIFKQYKKSGFDKEFLPVFIRNEDGGLEIMPYMERRSFK